MHDITTALRTIAETRPADPLAPVTVIVPSHAAALQLRRRLAEAAAFAAVRFETLPRLAELVAAGRLAAAGRAPLARPIADYVAGRVALDARAPFLQVRDLPGFGRALRQAFRRLRRGGIGSPADVTGAGHALAEVLRLYAAFRTETAAFYDEEDLMDAAAEVLRAGDAAIVGDLGSLYSLPPGPQSAAASVLLSALAAQAPGFTEVGEEDAAPATRMVLAPDPASEAREVVREVLAALQSGLALHEVAVFHGADPAYPRLLREAFEAAAVPAVVMPGIPLSGSATGRAVLALLGLPAEDFSRTRTMDFFALAPLGRTVPAGDGRASARTAAWDAVSRAAGITRGLNRWLDGLAAQIDDLEQELAEDPYVLESESRRKKKEFQRDVAAELRLVIESLAANLSPLREETPAADFIAAFSRIVDEYISPDAEGHEDVLREIAQLGTVDAVGGVFSLRTFHEALAANLDAGVLKEERPRIGEGVLVADYRAAAGLSFRHVVLCAAYEGALPAGPGPEPLLDDRTWSRLREQFPFVEDARLRIERSQEAALRAVNTAGEGSVTWSCPLYEPGATRDFYPSPLMVAAATVLDPEVLTATLLRRVGPRDWLRRSPSPLGTMLRGNPTSAPEVTLRGAISLRRAGTLVDASHPLHRAVSMLRERRGSAFTEWDGNLAAVSGTIAVPERVSPTSLEHYAACGYRYFCRSVLGLNVVEEPEERETMDPASRGGLVHDVLERFFRQVREAGRPAPREPWTDDDRRLLLAYLDEALAAARTRGLTGREVFSGHQARMLRADLLRFLDADEEFRAITGAVPTDFEAAIPERRIAGVSLRGRVDRIDRTPDGKSAWVIDYKTGGSGDFEKFQEDPLAGGTRLQLPVYLAAAGDTQEARALYWFITHRGGFKQVPFDPTPENMALFERTVEAIVEGVRGGAFPAVSGDENDYYGGWDNCRYCDFSRICSRRRDYAFAEKSSDPGMAAWFRVIQAARPSEDSP